MLRTCLKIALAGLAGAVLGSVPTAAQAEACSARLRVEPSLRDLPNAAAALDCERYWEGTLPATDTPALIMVETDLSLPPDFPNRVLDGLKKAEAAVPQLREMISAGEVVHVMITSVDDPNALASAVTVFSRCHILIHPGSWQDPRGLEDLEFVVAHELFHCIQDATLPTRLRSAGVRSGEDANSWWTEGSAEWFAHLAVHNAAQAWVDEFEDLISGAPLTSYDEEAWVFFAWQAHRDGPGSIMPFLRGLPQEVHTPDLIAQHLSENRWGRFARDYAAFQIRRPDGEFLEPDPLHRPPVEEIEEDKNVSVPRAPSQLMRQTLNVGEGRWEISGEPETAAFVSPLFSNGVPSGDWQRLGSDPVEIEVGCGETKPFALVAFGRTAEDYQYKVRQTGSTCDLSCASIPESLDACLVGTWVMADYPEEHLSSRFVRFMEGQVRAAGGEITDIHLPPPVAALYGDGSFTLDHPMSLAGNGTTDGVTFEMKMNFAANQDSGRWGSDGRNLLICPQQNTSSGAMTMVLPGMGSHTIPIDSTETIEGEPEGRASYTCSGDVLELTTEANEWFDSMRLTLTRIAGPGDVSSD